MTSAASGMPTLALLAGGLAMRLRPLTEDRPKSMVEVAGAPFIAHQLRLIRRQGVNRVVICAGYLAEQIRDFVGGGERFDLTVNYSLDYPSQLGTGGAVRNALSLLGPSFFIMYGDSYLDTAFAPAWDAFHTSGKSGLMTVFRNHGRWDRSNIEYEGGVIRRYDKTRPTPQMAHIDFGLSILKADAIASWPLGQSFDLAEVFARLVADGDLEGYEVTTRFREIGSLVGLQETERYLNARIETCPSAPIPRNT